MPDELADSRRRLLFYFSSVGLGSILLLGIARRSANDVGYDVYLAPIPSSRRGAARQPYRTERRPDQSLTGHPAVVVRKWNERRWRADQLQAPRKDYGESEMLALKHAYQMATDWHLKHPEL